MSRHAYGQGTVYQVGRYYYVQYYRNGQRFREPTRCTREREARDVLRERLTAIAAGRPVPHDARNVRLGDLQDLLHQDYVANGRKSWDRAAQAFDKHLARVFCVCYTHEGQLVYDQAGQLVCADPEGEHRKHVRGDRATEITAERLHRYVETRLAEGAARATVQNELAALKRAFSIAVERGKLASRPTFPTLSVSNARDEFLEPDEFAGIRDRLPEPLRGLITFYWLTGWRKQEALRLTWADVDFAAGVVRLRVGTTKNNEGRTFPFTVLPELQTVLERQRAYTDAVERRRGEPVARVFHREGRPIRDLYTAWRTACTRAGALGKDGQPKHLHDFRRSAVRRLERAGVPRKVAMALTGHRTEAVYLRYSIVREQDLVEGLGKVAALLQATPDVETVQEQPHLTVAAGGARG